MLLHLAHSFHLQTLKYHLAVYYVSNIYSTNNHSHDHVDARRVNHIRSIWNVPVAVLVEFLYPVALSMLCT